MPNSQRRPFVELDAWREEARQQKASADVALRKSFAGVFKAEGDGASAPIRIRITTTQRDRSKDTVNPAGWRLENYVKNPVVLWAHDYRSFPIAKDTGLTIDANGLTGTPQFATADENPWAPYCERLIRGGYLNAASVGFAPIKWSYNEEERGIDFDEQELLEYSIVPVPDNPGALVEAKRAGIEIGWIAQWAEKALDEWNGAAGMWVPRQAVEEARVISGRKGLVMLVPKAGTSQWDVLALQETKSDDGDADDATKDDSEDAPPCECCSGDCGEEGCACDAGTCTCDAAKCPHAGAKKSAEESADNTDAAKSDAGGDEVLELDEPTEATADDVLELVDDDDSSKTYDINEAELREIVQSTLKASLGPALTALTGRID